MRSVGWAGITDLLTVEVPGRSQEPVFEASVTILTPSFISKLVR